MSKYVVLGAGSWGTTVAKVIADGANEVTLWARKPELAQEIAKTGENSHYLPGTKPESVIVGFIDGTRKKYISIIQYFAIGLTFLGIQVFFMNNIFNDPELYKMSFLEAMAKSPGQEKNPFLNGSMDDSDSFNSLQSLFFTLSIPLSAFTTWISFRVKV